jgi:peptidoglycan/LPS O-acetylase OafA/YrhL
VTRPAVVFAVWAALLLVLAAVLWLVFRPHGTLPFLLPAGAVVITLASALALAWGRADRPGRRDRPPVSFGAVLVAVGAGLVVLSTSIGAWLGLMALIPTGFGLLGLVREGRSP